MMKRLLPALAALLLMVGCHTLRRAERHTDLWSLPTLKQTPSAEWGTRSGLVQEVFYQGDPYQGKPTRVFGYVGRPATGSGPWPAMVLVHGGGGKAFRHWAEHWARRGYVALAMDTAGCGPEARLPDGGPEQSDASKFRNFSTEETRDMWSYHAVSAVIRGVSLLAALPEVDHRRIGITGISWGGYLTCIVAGLDDRLKVAVPVYGCGFLGSNSFWKATSLAQMTPEARDRWLREFDPSQYLGRARCPMLFLNGATDFAYPLDSYRASYRLVPVRYRQVCVVPDLPHGHIWSFEEVDAFVDSVLDDATPPPRLGRPRIEGNRATAQVRCRVPVKRAALHYTTRAGEWQKRRWETLPADVRGDLISARLPDERPLAWFLSVADERGLRASTEHEEWHELHGDRRR